MRVHSRNSSNSHTGILIHTFTYKKVRKKGCVRFRVVKGSLKAMWYIRQTNTEQQQQRRRWHSRVRAVASGKTRDLDWGVVVVVVLMAIVSVC